MWVRYLGLEDPLEEGMATHFNILVWRIPRTKEPDGLQSMGLQRVRHHRATMHSTNSSQELRKKLWSVCICLNYTTIKKRKSYRCNNMCELCRHQAVKCQISSVQSSRSVVSNSLRPHELQHSRPPCPSATAKVHSNSRPSSQ